MPMMEGKRKPLSVMIGLMAGKDRKGMDREEPDDESGESYEEEADEGELAACQDVIDAIQKRSAKDLSAALSNWMEIAGYGKQSEE